MWHDGWGAGAWLATSLLMVIFWTLVVAGVIWLVRAARSAPPPSAGGDARRILTNDSPKEIGEDDYRARRDVLAAR